MKTDTTRVNANINAQLHRALKVKAATEGTTIGKLIERWVLSWRGNTAALLKK